MEPINWHLLHKDKRDMGREWAVKPEEREAINLFILAYDKLLSILEDESKDQSEDFFKAKIVVGLYRSELEGLSKLP